MDWVVYLVRCSDNSLYCGVTNRLDKRLAAHNSGKGAKYTRARRPVSLVAVSHKMSRSEALKLEYRIKQIPAAEKRQKLTTQEERMATNLKKELNLVIKEIKVLAKRIDKLVSVAGKEALAMAKPKKKAATKAKKAVAKKAAPKKAAKKKPAANKTVAKKAAKKKPAAKKASKVTAADTVLKVIDRSKKGVNTASLMKITGFNSKKVANIIFKLKKQGKIKNPEKGLYVKA